MPRYCQVERGPGYARYMFSRNNRYGFMDLRKRPGFHGKWRCNIFWWNSEIDTRTLDTVPFAIVIGVPQQYTVELRHLKEARRELNRLMDNL